MEGSVGYLFAIVFIVLAINLYIVLSRMRRGNRRKSNRKRIAPDEAKQAIWRDREIERRLEREQDGAVERVKLREETLALYEEVRRRHAEKDRLESLGFSANGDGALNPFIRNEEHETSDLEGSGLESIRLENPELNSYLAGSEPAGLEEPAAEDKVELIELDSYYTDNNDLDPFEIFKKKKK